MEKKDIVFGLNNFVCGGAQQQFVRQARYFDYTKFDIHLVTLFEYPEKSTIYDALPESVKVHRLDFKNFFSVKEWFKLSRILKQTKPDAIISIFFFSNVVFRVLGRIKSIPVIAREHNTTVGKNSLHRWLDRLLAKNSEPMVAVSEEVAEVVSREVGIHKDKFVVINNGIDLDEVDKEFRVSDSVKLKSDLGLSPDNKVALVVGRLVLQKRIDLVIQGFAQYVVARPEWHLVIVGSGWLLEKLTDEVDTLGLSDRVHFVGEVKKSHPYYKVADCLLSGSKMEGLSNVHLEALAHGVPIITTRTGGTSAIVIPGETGFIVSPETPNGIAVAMEKYSDADATALRVAAIKHSQNFSIQKTVEEYEDLFDKVVNE